MVKYPVAAAAFYRRRQTIFVYFCLPAVKADRFSKDSSDRKN
jgi:hypothetical protein